MENLNNQKPCVVQTPQGFSVSYKDHFLYSKYNPSKLILQSIENLQILPGTIILCNSPVLDYGLKELSAKVPENCLLVLCEAEAELQKFERENLKLQEISCENLFPASQELNNLPVILYKLSSTGKYRRVIRLDFSAGVNFHKEYYGQLENACVNSVMTFWKNRLTLTKFGRKYSQNLFSNLKILAKTKPLTSYFKSITKPIIVFGAGQSLDLFFEKNTGKLDFSNYFILCADTALQPLLKRNIKPDGVFVEEAQAIITKAFIGAFSNIHVFAGLSATRLLSHFIKAENLSFFTSLYTDASFIEDMKDSIPLPPINNAFGSVGLTAVYYALKFRSDDSVPVYVTGLDFSYSAGLTHARETLANTNRLATANKIKYANNYGAAFSDSAIKFLDKEKNIFYTSPNLKNYAETFNHFFQGIKNLFDAGDCGISLSIPRQNPQDEKTPQPAGKMAAGQETSATTESFSHQGQVQAGQGNQTTFYTDAQAKVIEEYLKKEKAELLQLRDLLTGKTKLSDEERKSQITKIVASKEYLFLHFADGYRFAYNQSFLNRIRSEIDFFLKYL